MGHYFKARQRGFTLLELVITGVVIGILATVVTVNLTEQRKASRDANRQLAVTNYSTAFEQYYAQNKTYMLMPSPCDIKPSGSLTYPGNANFKLPVGIGDGCVGYQKGGWGSLHRRNGASISNYGTTSIAEALRNAGFLQSISTDPRTGGEFPTRPASDFLNGSIGDFDDYILTLCNNEGKPAQKREEATEYAIYAQLERDPVQTMPKAGPSKQSCGGGATAYGWDTIQ